MINISQAFHRTSANAVDDTLTLTKAQMLAINDNLMPDKYLTVCQDDGYIYLYSKANTVDPTSGTFRKFEGGGGGGITVDDAISAVSENPVQNKVIKAALDTKADLVSGKVPDYQLPSYVDDVIEGYYNESNDKFYEDSAYTIEITPESGKIYISLDTLFEYRWSGSVYGRVNEGVVLGETSTTAYRGDRGKTAYDISQTVGDVTNLTTTAKSTIVDAVNEINNKADVQVTTMPTPTSALYGKVVEYVGTTDANYTKGYFYECILDGGNYKWVQKAVQPGGGGSSQVVSFPTASASELGKIYQYIGNKR